MFNLIGWCFSALLLLAGVSPVFAATAPIGYHLFDAHELELAVKVRPNQEKPLYVVVPMAVGDRREEVWNHFFDQASQLDVVPIIRWITVFENGSWQVPNRRDLVDATSFLSKLRWRGERIVILFNEPNHAAEWGGRVDPEGYAELAVFAANWLKTEKLSYTVLPAGLDADAPTNQTMMESLTYIRRVHQSRPELFDIIDAWTSHSYPNPGFESSAYQRGKNSIRGFEVELELLSQLTGRSFDVFITETGWRQTASTVRRLPGYYKEAVSKVWVDERIRAVILFVLKGVNGPFEEFSLLDVENQPTVQLRSLLRALDGK